MTTCSICHEEYEGASILLSVHLFLQGEWSAGTKDTAVLSWQRNVRLNTAVLAGRMVLRPIRPTRRAVSNYHREIARLIYPTQCSKCLSGVVFFQFRSLK